MFFEVLRTEDRPAGPGRMIIYSSAPDGRRGEIICEVPESIGARLREAILEDTDRLIAQALDATAENLGRWLADLVLMKAGRPVRPLDFTVPLPAHMHVAENESPYDTPGDAVLDHPRRIEP